MANDKKFVVKNGLTSQNISFVDDISSPSVTIEASVSGNTLSFSGTAGQLFSITDSGSGTIFSVNDISGIPSIEVDDDGTIRLAEFAGNVLIGTATDNGTDALQVDGNIAVTGTVDGRDIAADGTKLDGIEAGATGDQTASEILTAIKTVDGASSGLDADLLDGVQGASYLRSDVDDTLNAVIYGSDTYPLLQISSGKAYFSSTNRSTINLATSSSTGIKANVGGTEYTMWHAGNDGSGSGLDADTVDTLHASSFFRADTSNAVDVRFTSGDGRGMRFWDSDNYKIWMSSTGNGTYGGRVSGETTSDYNMYFRMAGGTNRGFVFESAYATKLLSINPNGVWTPLTINAATFNATSTTNGGFQGIDADSATLPSFTWTSDQNTGMWHAASDQIGFTTGGTNRVTISSSGLTVNSGRLNANEINGNAGQQLILFAGESTASGYTGLTNEYVYVLAESGMQIISSANNWTDSVNGAWATRNTATINDSSGNSSFPGSVTATSFVGPLATNASGDFTIDASGDIILDADGADILFKDNGTTVLSFNLDNNDYLISTGINTLGLSSTTVRAQNPSAASNTHYIDFLPSNAGNSMGYINGYSNLTITANSTLTLAATTVTGSGTVDFAKFLGNAADTAAAPSFSWTGDTNTGMYQPAADQIGFTTGGTNRVTISSSGLSTSYTVTAPTFNATTLAGGAFQGVDSDSYLEPGFTWTNDQNTGMYNYAADTIGFTAGGNDEFRIYTTYTLSPGSSRAPLFYDSQDTAYYVDPASTSRMAAIYFNGLYQGGVSYSQGPILTYTLTSGGSGYTDGTYTNQVLSGGSGVYATFDFTVSGGVVTVATLTERGSGFAVNNTITIPALGGTGSGGLITVNTVRTVDVSLYSSAAKIRLACNDTTLAANQEIGGIYFNTRDASAGGAGDKAYILGVAEGTSGGGKIQFWTSANGGSPTLCAEVGGSNDFRLYNTAGTFYHAFSNAPTATRTLTLPDITGTVLVTSGTTNTAGYFNTGTTTPSGSTRLNYSGYFYPTYINLVGSADTTTAATHYFVETGSDGYVRPKTLANVKTEIVTTAAVNAAAATTVGTVTSGVWNAGAVTSSGTVTAPTFNATSTTNGGFQGIDADSATTPSFTWTSDQNTGMYRVGADSIGFTAGGTNRLTVNTSVMTSTTTVTAPTFNATSTTNGGFQGIDADSATLPSFTWSSDLNTGIYHPAADQVGITTGGSNRVTVSTTSVESTLPYRITGGQPFWENSQAVTSNYTITNGYNAMSAGPITINSGVTVTVGAGETWTVI